MVTQVNTDGDKMKFSVLGSGSGGNAFYVEGASGRILVDAGFSCQEIIRRLKTVDINPESLDAIIISHEHVDHIRGAGILSRKFNIPVLINKGTYQKAINITGEIEVPFFIHTGQSVTIEDITIETFTKCHDAVDPMGIALSCHGKRLGIITDLGRSSYLVEERLKGSNGLIIEFNHDIDMLEEGPYPLHVKRRVRSQEGHLSNAQAGELLSRLYHRDMNKIVLAHLSKVNNIDKIAYQEAQLALDRCQSKSGEIIVSYQDTPTPILEL